MKDWWIKFGCFITGYNYALVRNSSEAVAKAVKKYLSAMLLITLLWGFIGYAFTQRYLHGDLILSLAGGAIMAFVIIQVERQIILTVGKNNWAFGFRVVIGLVMAIIGSVILDQIIFKEDIEKQKIERVQLGVSSVLPMKTQELTQQINQLDASIVAKETERLNIIGDIGRNPMIASPTTVNKYRRDTVTGRMALDGQEITTRSVINPKTELIPQIDNQLKALREQKAKKETDKLNIQQLLEDEFRSRVGFLDELQTLFSIIFSSGIALFVWSMIFLFLLSLELFVLVNKYTDNINDYDKTVLHQMETRINLIEKLKENK